MSQGVAIGIDLGGTNLKVALVDSSGRIVARATQPMDATPNPPVVMDAMVSLSHQVMLDAQVDVSAVIGVGVGSPGPLSFSRGVIIRAVNLAGWENIPLRDQLGKLIGKPVVLDNDGNAAAYGEFWAGRCRDGHDLALLTLGTGVGGGIILGGQVLRGHFENAGEMGHTIVEPRGRACSCGKSGCLEQYASASSVTKRALEKVMAGESSALGVRVKRGDEVTAQTVARLARDGDALCQRVWDETCFYLAIACINIQHTFNPEKVYLGGGLACAGNQLMDGVREQFDSMSWTQHDDKPTIELASLGYDAGVIGAAGLAWQHYSDVNQ